ncbi:endonuclease/exonuclease/phosphatase family protein [Sphingomicrobium marinum]|uniref:endonuclease/exonuclease/phosphatase family protein n=1 Tax=Sphingomicrobium marinum TaxID=1227950 RepID=UPI0022408D8B|nr:endonuclease/exonuclease/phosphatase family protein [Sphingomicrobium marinum]
MDSESPQLTGWRRWLQRVIAVLAIVLAIAAVLPFWQVDHWWVRVLDFPRLQLGLAGLVLLLLLALLAARYRGRRFLLIGSTLAAASLFQLSHVLPYFAPMPKSVRDMGARCDGQTVTLLGLNVLMDNRDYARSLALIEAVDADIVLLTEMDAAWEGAMAPLDGRYPHRLGRALPNRYGMHLYSKLPFEGQLLARLQPNIPSIRAQMRLANGETFALHGVHPEPPHPGEDSGERDAELVLVGREVREDGGAAIVFGDLNDVAWSETSQLFLEVSGMSDPREGRRLMPTFHADYPFMRWPLDHLFASEHWALASMERLDDVGSDHFPVHFTLCLRHDPERRLVTPQADADTEAKANEQLGEGLEEARSGDGEN